MTSDIWFVAFVIVVDISLSLSLTLKQRFDILEDKDEKKETESVENKNFIYSKPKITTCTAALPAMTYLHHLYLSSTVSTLALILQLREKLGWS